MQSSQDRNSEVQIDPLVASLTADQIDKDVAEYDALLDRNTSEAELHAFLARHTYFFNGYLRLLGNSPVYSKVKLGSDHEVDFAWFDTSSFGPEWHLVEIEPSRCKLFTRDGNPTAELTHAIQQVRDWNSWVHRYLDYARKIMPQIEYPVCHVFLGRRSELTEANTPKLRRFVHEHRAYLSLHTLDALSGAALSVKGLLQDGSGWWWVPMNALSHSELAAGLPKHAVDWMNFHASESRSEYWLEIKRQQRVGACGHMSEFLDQNTLLRWRAEKPSDGLG